VTRSLRIIVSALAACLLITGCGGDDPIPPKVARSLVRGLDDVEKEVRAGECRQTRPTLGRLDQTARTLPERVDEGKKATIEAGLGRLRELIKAQCRQKPKPKPKTPPPPVQTTPEPAPPALEPRAQPETAPKPPEPEQPKSNPNPTPEPEQPTPELPEMPEVPEMPEMPAVPN
jgi:outer membrane biosynthesis protein TonB